MKLTIARAGALAGTLTCAAAAVAAPAAGQTTAPEPAAGEAESSRLGVDTRRLHVRSGRTAAVTGTLRPATAEQRVALELRRDGRWQAIARDRSDARGRYDLRERTSQTMSVPARVTVEGDQRTVGRLNVYRTASASWYGQYGGPLACGGRLAPDRLGVAHKSLPCGTRVTFRHRGRSVRVPVIDRGPYVGGREYDLTGALAKRLGFTGVGPILATR